MRRIFRSFIYIAAIIVPIVLTGALGLITSVRTSFPRPADADAVTARIVAPPAPAYDPTKPTVAVVLGAQVHEITDTIGPYATFKESGLYNVYMVADSKTPRPLGTRTAYTMTSALDVIRTTPLPSWTRSWGAAPTSWWYRRCSVSMRQRTNRYWPIFASMPRTVR
jgi:hypothetical protein